MGERLFSDPRFGYADSGMSCASCHQSAGTGAGSPRLFDDPALVSAVPARNDGQATTPRNTPPLVDALAGAQAGWGLLHWDGEFACIEDLVAGTFTGRNFGWLPAEKEQAVRHFARVIREDQGVNPQGQVAPALPYGVLLGGGDEVPEAWRLAALQSLQQEQQAAVRLLEQVRAGRRGAPTSNPAPPNPGGG